MAFFRQSSTPPASEEGALAYVLWIAREEQGATHAQSHSAVAQDLGIYGDDVDDFVRTLAERYGEGVFNWPWHRFTDLNEGTPIMGCLLIPLFPFRLALRLVSGQPIISAGSGLERLELGHIAKVLEHGEWAEP